MTPGACDSGQRIQVALNTAGSSQVALNIASHLADSLGLLLEGVFIEDEGLLHMSELPFLREVSSATLMEQAIDPRRMRQSLAALARQLEAMVQSQAAEIGVQYLFRTWRGHPSLAILSAEFDARILAVSGAPAYRQTLFRTYRSPVTNLYLILDQHTQTEKLVTMVKGLSGRLPVTISILLWTDAGYRDARWEEAMRHSVAELQPNRFYNYKRDADVFSLLGNSDNPVLFIDAINPLLLDPGFEHLIKSLAATVFIIR